MKEPTELKRIEAYATKRFGAVRVELISSSNNLVFRVDRDRGPPVALRVLLDRDIDLEMSLLISLSWVRQRTLTAPT